MALAILAAGFNGVQFDVVNRDGQPWLQSGQIALALGFEDEVSVHNIVECNHNEFSISMTATIDLMAGPAPQKTRIFSLHGCLLLCMYAHTPVAELFQVWILHILEQFYQPFTACAAEPPALPVYTPPKADLASQALQNCTLVLDQTAKVVKSDTYELGGFHPGNPLGYDFAGAIEAQIDVAIENIRMARHSIDSALFLKQASDKAGKLLR